MNEITARQIDIIKHAVAWPKLYRNRFCTGPGSKDYDDCEHLVSIGFMDKMPEKDFAPQSIYVVTKNGLDFLNMLDCPEGNDLIKIIERQRSWSCDVFGPTTIDRTEGIIKHIEEECDEARKAENRNDKLKELVDIIILALDAAWRLGFQPLEIVSEIRLKMLVNKMRKWPNWQTADPEHPMNHTR